MKTSPTYRERWWDFSLNYYQEQITPNNICLIIKNSLPNYIQNEATEAYDIIRHLIIWHHLTHYSNTVTSPEYLLCVLQH